MKKKYISPKILQITIHIAPLLQGSQPQIGKEYSLTDQTFSRGYSASWDED